MLGSIFSVLASDKPLKHSHGRFQLSVPAWKAGGECRVGWKPTERGENREKIKYFILEVQEPAGQEEGRKIWELREREKSQEWGRSALAVTAP